VTPTKNPSISTEKENPSISTDKLNVKTLVLGHEIGLALDTVGGCAATKTFLAKTCAQPPADQSTKNECLTKQGEWQNCVTYRTVDFDKPVEIELVPRSAEGVIYYLGEVVRRELYPDQLGAGTVPRRTIAIKYGPPDQQIPVGICQVPPSPNTQQFLTDDHEWACEPVFVVNTVPPGSERFVSVVYDHSLYALPNEPTGPAQELPGRTYQVSDVVTQLIGLNKTAKSVPATSVFTLISP
jgi:hypothetical protein